MSRPGAGARTFRIGATGRLGGVLLWLLLAVVVVSIVAGVLRWQGYRLILQRPHGDSSQSRPIHLGSVTESNPPPTIQIGDAKLRNVILVIADGLGINQIQAARAQLVGLAGRLYFEQLPVTGWVTTQSSDNLLTDSASSATSLATGVKVPVGALSMSADGRRLVTLAEAAAAEGLAVGLVTDSYLWDATPAAFAVHVPSRKDRAEIARQMARSRISLLIGERSGDDASQEESLADFDDQGYLVADSWSGLEGLPAIPQRLVALLPPGSVADPLRPPSLATLARVALSHLQQDSQGFLLVLETEEPDSGAHARDLQRVTAAVAALDEAMREIVAFASGRDDTLVLLTSDHETGGLILLWGEEGKPLGVQWTAGHTGQPVPLYAYGPEAQRFSGVLDNTEIPRRLAVLLGLDALGALASAGREPPS